MRYLIVGLSLLAPVATPLRATAQASACYHFAQPLGYSAMGKLELGDSAWYVIELRPNGAVARPLFRDARQRDRWTQRSTWRQTGDTLHIRVFDGLVGWDVTMRAASAAVYVGSAEYLSDVRGPDAPQRVPIRALKTGCASPPG